MLFMDQRFPCYPLTSGFLAVHGLEVFIPLIDVNILLNVPALEVFILLLD
jgi:hypothetical protein